MLKNSPGFKDRLAALGGVIWDLDNTLYRFDGDFEVLCHVAAAKAGEKAGMDMGYDEILEICLRSYEIHGHSYRLLIDEYKLDKHQMHYDFHSFIDETLIKKSLALVELFEKTDLEHVIVTHASREWAHRALSHLGLDVFFPEDRIIPAEEIDFMRKSESRAPFEKAIAKLGTSPDRIVVVEDIAVNLSIPFGMNLGTVLVHYGRPPDPMPDYIDMACNNAIDFFETMIACKAAC